MWAQEWNNIYDLLVPFPEVTLIDVTATMRAQNYTPHRMFRTAESFYTSIGLDPMTQTFWEKSMFTRPSDREVVCHASAEDFSLGDDYRLVLGPLMGATVDLKGDKRRKLPTQQKVYILTFYQILNVLAFKLTSSYLIYSHIFTHTTGHAV